MSYHQWLINITLFIVITMFCGSNNSMRNIPRIHTKCEDYYVGWTSLCWIFLTFGLNVKTFYKILLVPQNIVMALNNVMNRAFWEPNLCKLKMAPFCSFFVIEHTYLILLNIPNTWFVFWNNIWVQASGPKSSILKFSI